MTQNQKIIWDETEIAQNKAKDLLETGTASNEEDAFNMAICDYDLMEWEFEDFKEHLKAILDDISPDGSFYIEGRNMGWRHLSAHVKIQADSAEDYIEKTFPKTSEWSLRGEYDPKIKKLEYTLSHHDAPTGEFYSVQHG